MIYTKKKFGRIKHKSVKYLYDNRIAMTVQKLKIWCTLTRYQIQQWLKWGTTNC